MKWTVLVLSALLLVAGSGQAQQWTEANGYNIQKVHTDVNLLVNISCTSAVYFGNCDSIRIWMSDSTYGTTHDSVDVFVYVQTAPTSKGPWGYSDSTAVTKVQVGHIYKLNCSAGRWNATFVKAILPGYYFRLISLGGAGNPIATGVGHSMWLGRRKQY